MKKTAIVLMALIAAMAILFTACGSKMDKDMNTTTTLPNTTVAPATTIPDSEHDSLFTTDNNSTAYNGVPESTSTDSALGDAVEDAADGARNVIDGIGNGAERAADDVGEANERMAEGVREAETKSNAR